MKHKPDQAFGHWEVFCFFLAIPKTDPLSRPTCSSRLGRAAAADRRRRFFFAIAVRGERWSSGVRGRTMERSARRRRRWTESAAVGRRRARAASYGGHRQQRGKFCSDSGRRSTAGLLYRHETGSRETSSWDYRAAGPVCFHGIGEIDPTGLQGWGRGDCCSRRLRRDKPRKHQPWSCPRSASPAGAEASANTKLLPGSRGLRRDHAVRGRPTAYSILRPAILGIGSMLPLTVITFFIWRGANDQP